jgi:hypothetical protein
VMARLIQFVHPGGEPYLPPGSVEKPWNQSDVHERCFLQAHGPSMADLGQPREEGEPMFWGQWEPPATVIQRFPGNAPQHPAMVLRPYSVLCPNTGTPMSPTDPFVFGETFLYSHCLQGPAHEFLRDLEAGDVILFGSRVDRAFVLDTVFVVAYPTDDGRPSSVPFNLYGGDQQPALAPWVANGAIPPEFVEATLRPWELFANTGGTALCRPSQGSPSDHMCRLYWGATPEHPVHSMFSYAPASLMSVHPTGFARPRLQLPFIRPRFPRGARVADPLWTLSEVYRAWRQVVEAVRSQGLRLGVRFDL